MFTGIAQELRRYAHFFICTIVNSLAGPGAFHLGIVMTGRLTGDADIVGYYSNLLYALQPLYLLPMALATVMIPTISRHHGAGRPDECVAVAQRASSPLFLVMTLIWGCGVILGWEAIVIASGKSMTVLLVAFQIILFGVYLYLISLVPCALLNATEHIAVMAKGGAFSVAVAVVVWWVAVRLPGRELLGAAAGYGALQLGKATWAFVAGRRVFGWRPQLGRATVFTIPAVLALGAFSLTSERRIVHLGIACLFVVLFSAVYARMIKEYAERLIVEARSYVAKW
jgi:O-antigen/teichoic acid export membrane protein